jgi:hypothetical protein
VNDTCEVVLRPERWGLVGDPSATPCNQCFFREVLGDTTKLNAIPHDRSVDRYARDLYRTWLHVDLYDLRLAVRQALKNIYDVKPIKLTASFRSLKLKADLGVDAAPLR